MDGASKRYVGERTAAGCEVTVHEGGTAASPLDPRLDLRKHSLTGFEWGYSGSGPAQLSLALLVDALGDVERAETLYQNFKFSVVARLGGDRWEMSQDDIHNSVSRIEDRRDRLR
jgi:hypothetical protein